MELGYVFYPPKHPGVLGHPQLDIRLYDVPTGLHFDPYEAIVPIYDPEAGIQELSLYHPTGPENYHVSAGRIIIRNHVDKRVEAFSFGGDLEVENHVDFTLCRLLSSAPIFDLAQFRPAEVELVTLVESYLARMHAQWQANDTEYELSLGRIEPTILFLAMMVHIEKQQRRLPAMYHDDGYWELIHSIHSAIRFVEPDGILPPDLPTLDDLI